MSQKSPKSGLLMLAGILFLIPGLIEHWNFMYLSIGGMFITIGLVHRKSWG